MSMATTRTLLWGGFYTVGSATNSVTNRGSVKPIDRIMADGQFIISVPADGWVRLIYNSLLFIYQVTVQVTPVLKHTAM